MTKIVVGLFDDFNNARDTVDDLLDDGIAAENISVISRDQAAYGGVLPNTGAATETVGGFGDQLVDVNAIDLPGIGRVMIAGPLVEDLGAVGTGATTRGLTDALIADNIPDDQAQLYAEGVRRGGTLISVITSNDKADDAVGIMTAHNPVDIKNRSDYWQNNDWQGFNANAQPMTPEEIDLDREAYQKDYGTRYGTNRDVDLDVDRDVDVDEDTETIPLAEEEMRVGKRQTTEGVRIHTFTTEKPVREDVELRKEEVDVERHPVDRPARAEDLDDAFQEKTIEMEATNEEVVAEKRPRVVEELEVKKTGRTEHKTVEDTVRRQEAEVERTGGEDLGFEDRDYDEFEPMYRDHFNTTFTNTGYTYEDYQPAYQYGYDLANDERYRNRSWNEVEPVARRRWETEHSHNAWDDFKDAIYQGWYSVTGQR